MIPLAIAGALFAWKVLEEQGRPLYLLLPLLAWLAPLYNPPRVVPLGLITPLVIFGLIALLLSRGTACARPAAPL